MAQFRAVIQGNRGEASRLGSRASGISASIDGWKAGVEVWGNASGDGSDGDVFTIFARGGSYGGLKFRIGEVRIEDGEVVFTPASDS